MTAISRDLFFFQAEDGIRDGHVTGVQTCALPIYRGRRAALRSVKRAGAEGGGNYPRTELIFRNSPAAASFHKNFRCRAGRSLSRSEERRVGKECRCWWVLGHS